MNKKAFLVFCILVSFVFLSLCRLDDVYADGWVGTGTAVGGIPGGAGGSADCKTFGSGKGWMAYCSGVSWIYYEATGSSSNKTYLPYPYNGPSVNSSDEDKAYISPECSNNGNGGFWAFGFNAIGVGYYGVKEFSDGTTGQQTGDLSDGNTIFFDGHWAPAVWGSTGYSPYNAITITYPQRVDSGSVIYPQEIGNYRAKMAGDVNTVLANYNSYLSSLNESTVDELPSGLYAFCYWDGIDSNAEFYGSSHVSVESGEDNAREANTGVKEKDSNFMANAETIGVELDNEGKAQVNLSFDHSVYSDKNNSGIQWKVMRSNNIKSAGTGYTMSGSSFANSISGAVSAGVLETNYQNSGYYGKEVLRDNYTVNFNKPTPGNYEFCESLYVEGTTKITTKVCAVVKVGDVEVSTSVELSGEMVDGTEVVYAGETAKAKGVVNVTPSTMSINNGRVAMVAYTTNENQTGGEAKIINGNDFCNELSYSGNCEVVKTVFRVLFNGRYDSGLEYYNVFDDTAGKYYCMVTAASPISSSADYSKWYVSAPKCLVIAKRATFQVWGGSLGSNGNITTSISAKRNFDDGNQSSSSGNSRRYLGGGGSFSFWGSGSIGGAIEPIGEITDPIDVTDEPSEIDIQLQGVTVFGSWVEQAIISNGEVRGLASGSAGGTNGSKEGINASLCAYRSQLSFANYGMVATDICNASNSTDVVGKININPTISNRRVLVDYLESIWGGEIVSGLSIGVSPISNRRGQNGHSGDVWTIVATLGGNDGVMDYTSQFTSSTGKTISIYQYDGNYTYMGGTLNKAKYTGIIDVSKDIEIKGDLIDNNSYGSSSSVSQMIIYAGGNIKIDCGVARIDAILIAGGTVSTCGEHSADASLSDWNDAVRNKQLKINGMVIADKIDLGRTYGNTTGMGYGTGNNSGSATPAEIINYDTSMLIWGDSVADVDESNIFTTVYQHEVAPRY